MSYKFFRNEKKLFGIILVEIFCLIILVFLSAIFLRYQHLGQENFKQASRIRYESFLLADQLRQSSDDLTRMVRSYVSTGDKRFEDYFWDILDIRNGKKIRPLNYERVYWDFITVKKPVPPLPAGRKVALESLMKDAGFTEIEFQLLEDAKKGSDELVFFERIAMHAMKGEFQDETGEFTIRGEPDPEMARQIVFGNEYHQAKMKIMEPINDFFEAIDKRTSQNVTRAISQVRFFQRSLICVFSALILNGLLVLFTAGRHQKLLVCRYKSAIDQQALELTERKRTEEELQESEEMFRTLFESSRDAIMILAPPTWLFTSCNPATVELFRMRDETKFISLAPWDLSPAKQPDGKPSDKKTIEMIATAMSNGSHFFEWTHCYSDGTPFPSEVLLTRMEQKGQVLIQATVRDITERKRAEEELKRSEFYLLKSQEVSKTGSYIYDIKNDSLTASEVLNNIWGIHDDKKKDANKWLSILHPDDRDEMANHLLNHVIDGKNPFNKEYRMINQETGDTVWVHGMGELELGKNDEPVYMVGTIQNITERKRAEEELQESEEKFRSFSEQSLVGTYLAQDGVFKYVNPKFADIFGYTVDECLNDMHFRKLVHPDDLPLAEEQIRRREAGETPSVLYGLRAIKKNGKIVDVEIYGSSTLYRGSLAITGTVLDVTDRNRLQAQLQQAQKMESIGTLAGGIAHDFNNILSPIMIHSEMSMMELPPDSPVQNSLRQIFQAGKRARDLVKQILTFARKREGERVQIEMSRVLKEVIKFLRSSIPTTIDIQQDIDTERDTVLADPTQLNQVIMNLCTNAAHAMEERGGILEVVLESENLDPESSEEFHDLESGRYVKLTVKDSGQGIEPEIIDNIFEPYFTTKEVDKGTGMGLALVHGIVQSYGGAITVESEVGKGTAFHVFLPLAEEEADVHEPRKDSVELITGSERILFVDDEKAAVNAIQPILEKLGYKVVARTSSIEALEAFSNNPQGFDLVITDMTMPNMTGKDLAKEMMSIRSDIPIILCTGFSEKIDERKAKEMGISAYVMKPIVMREIVGTIRKVLDKK